MDGGKRSAWMKHVKATMKMHKGTPLSEVLKMAKKTYHLGGTWMGKMEPMGGKRTRKHRGGGKGVAGFVGPTGLGRPHPGINAEEFVVVPHPLQPDRGA